MPQTGVVVRTTRQPSGIRTFVEMIGLIPNRLHDSEYFLLRYEVRERRRQQSLHEIYNIRVGTGYKCHLSQVFFDIHNVHTACGYLHSHTPGT